MLEEYETLKKLDAILNPPTPTTEPKPKRKYTKRKASKPAARKG